MTTVFLVSRFSSIAFLWYNVVGALTVFAVGSPITAVSGRTGEARPLPGAREPAAS